MTQSIFFSLPLEIRRQIYEELLTAPDPTPDIMPPRTTFTQQHYHEYYKPSSTTSKSPRHVLRFRNSNDESLVKNTNRTSYKIRSDRFRARCIDTTYVCENLPEICVAVLQLNKQIHNEACQLLYNHYTFDFDTHVEACAPFLVDLTPYSRSCISRISVVKRALPYDKDFDRCEWATMCDCISSQLALTRLDLGIVGGKPTLGWEAVKPIAKEQYEGIVQFHDNMQWVDDLAKIRRLEGLVVRACVEHCPPPMSSGMAFFVAFSASIEGGFKDYLMERMMAPMLVV